MAQLGLAFSTWLLSLGGVFFGGCFFGRYGTRREEALAHKTGRVQCRLERLRFKSCHSSEPSKARVGRNVVLAII